MTKAFAISLVLVAIVAAISWYIFSTKPAPRIVAPISDASDAIITKETAILPTREQTNSIPEASRLPMTNVTESEATKNPKTEIAEVKMDNQHVDEVSQDKALEIARGAIGKTKYASTLPIAIEDAAGEYCITFPVDKSAPAGFRYMGPDYAAEVRIDKKTGKVVQVHLSE